MIRSPFKVNGSIANTCSMQNTIKSNNKHFFTILIVFIISNQIFLFSSTHLRAFTNASIQGETSSFLRSSG